MHASDFQQSGVSGGLVGHSQLQPSQIPNNVAVISMQNDGPTVIAVVDNMMEPGEFLSRI